jgi:chemotaxis protein histidine kinase CheA
VIWGYLHSYLGISRIRKFTKNKKHIYNYMESIAPGAELTETVVEYTYPDALIYVLQCIDNYYYIGSTINDPRWRLSNHKQCAIKYPERHVYKHINAIGWQNVKIQVVEKRPCNTKQELYALEDTYIHESIGDPYCLNYNRAFLTPEEHKENIANYYLANREKIIEQHKEYLAANKEQVDAYQAAYRKEHAEERAAAAREYAAAHPEQVKARRKAYYEANKEVIIDKQKAYAEARKEDVQARKKAWAAQHKERVAATHKEYVETHKAEIQARGKAYYEANKAAIDEKNRAYRAAHIDATKAREKAYREAHREKLSQSHTCECGGKYTMNHEAIHRGSKRHLKHEQTLLVS